MTYNPRAMKRYLEELEADALKAAKRAEKYLKRSAKKEGYKSKVHFLSSCL